MTISPEISSYSEAEPWPSIDHPAQADWWERARHVLDAETSTGAAAWAALEERFANTRDNTGKLFSVESLIGALKLATDRTCRNRLDHENENLSKLALSDAEMRLYRSMAGQPEYIGEYVRFFARAAVNISEREAVDEDRSKNKVVLDAGGNLQIGDWESTVPLDTMCEELLPERLKALDPHIDIRLLKTKRERIIKYKFFPQFIEGESYGSAFEYGIVRRRRGVANFWIPVLDQNGETKVVEVEQVKQATAMVVMRMLEEPDMERIYEEYDMQGLTEFERKAVIRANASSNSLVAKIAGNVFRYGIEKDIRGTTRDTVPIAAYNLLTVRCAGVRALLSTLPEQDTTS